MTADAAANRTAAGSASLGRCGAAERGTKAARPPLPQVVLRTTIERFRANAHGPCTGRDDIVTPENSS